ncbi:MAG: hypothetical protein AB7G11_08635 [Phycisphaerales bacterium]
MQTRPPAAPTMNVIRVFVLALIGGMLMFAVVTLYLRAGSPPPAAPPAPSATPSPPASSVLLLALGAMSLLTLPLYFLLPALQARQHALTWRRSDSDADRDDFVMRAMMTQTVLRAALVEGVGLFGIVIFLLEGHWLALAAPAVVAVLLVALLPTRASKEQFLRRLQQTP